MATKKKSATKPVKSAKAAKPAKKTVAAKPAKKAAPVKPVKKAAPAKKTVAAKSAKKAAPVKKVATAKKAAPAKKKEVKNSKTVNKKTNSKTVATKKTAPAKKAAPKKAAPAKKVAVAPAKKTAPPAKKATPAKKAAPVAKAPVKKVAPVKVAPPKKAAPAPVVTAKKAAPAKATAKKAEPAPVKKSTEGLKPLPKPTPIARPMATRSTVREEKKPNVIIAHRRLENKSKRADEAGRTMINYQPDYTRSILDQPVQQSGPVYRYSDEELNEFKELILNRMEAARKELTYLQGLITRKDEAGTEDTENRYMNMEDGSGAMEREQLAQLASRQIQFIGHLEKALMRIENKTYGICRVTGKLIDKARLRAVPHATLSIEAKKTMNK